MCNDYSPICNNGIVGALPATPIAATPPVRSPQWSVYRTHVAAANITAQVRPSLHKGEQSPHKGEYHGKQGRHAGLPLRHAPNGYKTHHLEQPHFGRCNGRCGQRPYGADMTVAKSAVWMTVFVIMQINIVETAHYPSLRNNNLTTGGYL
jgi:hypothetical protein